MIITLKSMREARDRADYIRDQMDIIGKNMTK
jgi:hypothetical protein